METHKKSAFAHSPNTFIVHKLKRKKQRFYHSWKKYAKKLCFLQKDV